MRRKKGTLLPLEVEILLAAAQAKSTDDGWIHGFGLAKALQGDSGRLTAHGTLYKALGRLTAAGLLDDQWEDPEAALAEGRPRRRLYQVNGAGLAALAKAESESASTAGVKPTIVGVKPTIAPT